MKKEIILRKAIIDNDCKVIRDNKLAIKDSKEFESFCSANDDICFVLNDDGNGYLYQEAMRTMLMLWPLTPTGLVNTLENLYSMLVTAHGKQINFLIDNISWIAYNDGNEIPVYLKEKIIKLCKIKKRDYQKLLNAFTKRGELSKEFINDNKNQIDPRMISRNTTCDLELLEPFTESQNFDWYSTSTRDSLTKEFIDKHQDNIIFEAIIYHNPLKVKDFTLGAKESIIDKFMAADFNLNKEVDKENYIEQIKMYNFCKCGRAKWNTLHTHVKLSNEFIIAHLDELNIDGILKYYKLTKEFKDYINARRG